MNISPFHQEYPDWEEISSKLFDKLSDLSRYNNVTIEESVDEFKNNELLNLYWGDRDTFADSVKLRITLYKGILRIYRCRMLMDLNREEERAYWHAMSAGDTSVISTLSQNRRAMFDEEPAWVLKLVKWTKNGVIMHGDVSSDSTFGPGHKGDSLIDCMTWFTVNKYTIINKANAVIYESTRDEANEVREHTMSLLKGII